MTHWLLFALICRRNPYAVGEEPDSLEDDCSIVQGSEFEDGDGCLYRVVSIDATHVRFQCFYPQCNNTMFGLEKYFDLQRAKELIELRLNG